MVSKLSGAPKVEGEDLHTRLTSLTTRSRTNSGTSTNGNFSIHSVARAVGVASLDLFLAKVNKINVSEPLKEGDLVELECVAFNSRPPANVSWFNGQDAIEKLETTTTTSTTVTMSPLSPPSAGNKLRHKRLLQRNQIHQNSDGQTYNTHSFLSIKLSRHEHRAQITCQAQNSPMRQPMSKSLELQVQHAPIVLMEPAAGLTVNEAASNVWPLTGLAEASSNNNVIAGTTLAPQPNSKQNSVNIYCIYSANPTELVPNSTRWFKDDQLLNAVAEPHTPMGESANDNENYAQQQQHFSETLTATGYPVLTINQVNRRDAGLYKCQLANSIGHSERLPTSEALKLEVNFRPAVQLRLFKVISSNTPNATNYRTDELAEVDLNQDLVLPGNSFVLVCEVLEARPAKINKFHWYKQGGLPAVLASRSSTRRAPKITAAPLNEGDMRAEQSRLAKSNSRQQQQLIGQSETGQFVLNSLPSYFTPTLYSCSASNALGPSEQSNQIDLQLSYLPGPSSVVPVNDKIARKTILASGKPAHPAVTSEDTGVDQIGLQLLQRQQPVAAASELLLECLTPDLGQPRANNWLWFKNDQPIETFTLPEVANLKPPTSNFTNNQLINSINKGQDSLSTANSDSDITGTGSNRQQQRHRIKLISSGRYLLIPSIELAHKGNYSCVAANRLGPSTISQRQQQKFTEPILHRDDSYYQLSVALAPSFVQPLVSQTQWQEKISDSELVKSSSSSSSQLSGQSTIELVCHVQCEPICQIEWLRNGEPLDIKRQQSTIDSDGFTGTGETSYVSYSIEQSIMAENEATDTFKSVESKLLLHILPIHGGFSSSSNANQARRILERRKLLSGSNYTCQSGPNSMGPAVRSTTRLVVQYPPEKVLINASSDRLSLVEGSNGPNLSCEAFGEPRVQFRWLLVRANGSIDALFSDNSLSSDGASTRSSQDQKLFGGSSDGHDVDGPGSDNDIDSSAKAAVARTGPGLSAASATSMAATGASDIPQKPVVLTHESSERVGVTPGCYVSVLDLSGQSVDKKQSGQYVCEASNKLGVARQSIYVNVLYKPICATLHLHSLDVTVAPSLDNSDQDRTVGGSEPAIVQVKPFKSTISDEYQIVRETSEDFIRLRKMLVLAPLLNRYISHGGNRFSEDGNNSDSSAPTFKDSIFQTILNEKKLSDAQLNGGVTLHKSINGSSHSKDDISDNLNSHHGNLLMSVESGSHTSNLQSLESNNNDNVYTSTGADSWQRFNNLLLKFLNNYMRQVRGSEEPLDASRATEKRQSRRSDRPDSYQEAEGGLSWKNLVTFACMAQDGNPMTSLTFDWSIGLVSLPETGDSQEIEKPRMVYTNANNTLSIFLVRRLDTRSSMNPFQISLLTLNIVIADQATKRHPEPKRDSRQSGEPTIIASRRGQPGRNRYQSNSRRPSGSLQLSEFGARQSTESNVELDERNWQTKLGTLLACSVSNQIGTSEPAPVRVNILEREKSQESLSEFAKWRMPSLGHKSLLLISIVLGFMLIIIATSALLLSPYLKELSIARNDASTHSSKADSNTGQSTSSQKSSVLGLLNNGDSSLQGSSDDDSSARINNINATTSIMGHSGKLSGLEVNTMAPVTYQDRYNPQVHRQTRLDYDRPRVMTHEQLRDYRPESLQGDNPHALFGNQDQICHDNQNYAEEQQRSISGEGLDRTKPSISKAVSSKLMSNLRQLSKLRVDRVSDFTNSGGLKKDTRDLHLKTVSNTETSTTGLSVSALESDLQLDQMASPLSTGSASFFRQSNVRQSHLGFSRQPSIGHQHSQLSHQMDPKYYLLNRASDSRMSQLQPKHTTTARGTNQTLSVSSAYSNMFEQNQPFDAMDEFMRQRGLDTSPTDHMFPLTSYGSQSVKHQPYLDVTAQVQSDSHDYNKYYQRPNPPVPPTKPRPPMHPRTATSTMFRSTMDELRPQVATRTFQQRQLNGVRLDAGNTQCQTMDNRFSMPNYSQSFVGNQDHTIRPEQTAYLHTIDSHLSRMVESATSGRYAHQQQLTYANATAAFIQGYYDDQTNSQLQSPEHIYDINAYATPEQTPLRRLAAAKSLKKQSNNAQLSSSTTETNESERPRVSQLIQTFDSKDPEC